MKEKKLPFGAWVLILLFTAIITYTLYFTFTSYSYTAMERYMAENSEIGATKFKYDDIEMSAYQNDYVYAVAQNGTDENSTECYILRQKEFLGFWNSLWTRYVPFAHGSDGKNAVSSMTVTFRDDKGEKEPGNTLVLFGSKVPKGTFDLEYDIESSEGIQTVRTTPFFQDGGFTGRIRWNGMYGHYGWRAPEAGEPTTQIDEEGNIYASSESYAFGGGGEGEVCKISNVKILNSRGKVIFEF